MVVILTWYASRPVLYSNLNSTVVSNLETNESFRPAHLRACRALAFAGSDRPGNASHAIRRLQSAAPAGGEPGHAAVRPQRQTAGAERERYFPAGACADLAGAGRSGTL